MHEMTLRWEDPVQLRAVLGHLYDILEADRPTALQQEGLGVYATDELRAELTRREDAVPTTLPAAAPEPEKAKRGRKSAAAVAAAVGTASTEPAANEPEPEPDPAALPKEPDKAPPPGDPITANVPDRSEMESLLSSLYALTSMEFMRDVILEHTGQPTLSKAPPDTWGKLKVALLAGIEEHKAKA